MGTAWFASLSSIQRGLSAYLLLPVPMTTGAQASVAFVALGNSNLVDPASSHMLVSKIKPCMSKYKFFTAKL